MEEEIINNQNNNIDDRNDIANSSVTRTKVSKYDLNNLDNNKSSSRQENLNNQINYLDKEPNSDLISNIPENSLNISNINPQTEKKKKKKEDISIIELTNNSRIISDEDIKNGPILTIEVIKNLIFSGN